ncbi:hypothetical protein L6164_006120 [Bauhinia variegata]|uniref:Uncharacterized protein n=1 Tax=Bauhinia variegata TaxID=167791 RepID=A0ACB9PSS4_BAUVA|nr:hypothetical protein L6164_006120 [Bauhinia variegata]
MDNNPPSQNVPQNDTASDQSRPIQIPSNLLATATALSEESASPRPVASPSGQHGSRRHPLYKGIRWRSGKWVSEIREPRKTTRIWLGTYPTPEMAAAAYDVAALALKGPDTPLNFANSIISYPIPASLSATDIRSAAAAAAEARLARAPKQGPPPENPQSSSSGSSQYQNYPLARSEEFIDEDELLNMPSLLDDMARGMQVSPPRMIKSPSSDDSPGNSDGDTLWNY